jgi:hypothetical protein
MCLIIKRREKVGRHSRIRNQAPATNNTFHRGSSRSHHGGLDEAALGIEQHPRGLGHDPDGPEIRLKLLSREVYVAGSQRFRQLPDGALDLLSELGISARASPKPRRSWLASRTRLRNTDYVSSIAILMASAT